MSIEDRAKAAAKNVEGKAKQAESEVRHGIEDVKDNVKKNID